MFRPHTNPVTVLRRLVVDGRLAQSGKVPISSSVVARNFSSRSTVPLLLQSYNTSNTISKEPQCSIIAELERFPARGYATTKKGTTKSTKTAKKKTAAKKKPKKKTAPKKPKKKAAPKKEKKIKRPQVAKVPSKRPISAFVTFVSDALKRVGGTNNPERFARAAAEWRALSEAEKANWKTRADEVNAVRLRAHESFIANLSPQEIKEENKNRRILAKKFDKSGPKTKPIADPNAPKRPATAYIRFYQEQFGPEVRANSPIREVAREAGQRWRALSEAEKRPYVQAFEEAKARYQRELADYLGQS